MKKFLVPLIGAAIALISLNGCRQESLSTSDDTTNGKQVVGYAAFAIKMDSPNTRAYEGGVYDNDFEDEDDNVFNKGSFDEYALSENTAAHRAFFFDDNGVFFGSSMLTSLSENNDNDHNHANGYGETETYYAALTKHAASSAAAPTQVLVVLNGYPYRLDELDKELAGKGSAALTSALQWISLNAGDSYGKAESDGVALYNDGSTIFFTMSSVTYIRAGGDTGNVETAVDITKHLYPTAEEALSDPVTIYVERVVAKFTVGRKTEIAGGYTFSSIANEVFEPTVWDGDNAIAATKLPVVSNYDPADNIAKADNKSWSIKIVNWGLNALEPNTFLFKNLVGPSAPYSVDTKFFTKWNSADYHRSYWAVDQHYLEDYNFPATSRTGHKYSDQYRPYAGKNQGIGYNDLDGHVITEDLVLDYFSYIDIAESAKYINRYSLENTFDYDSEKMKSKVSYAPLRYGTHILLAAELQIDGEPKDLFYAYSVYWEKFDDYLAYAFSKMCSTYADGKEHVVKDWKTGEERRLPQAFDKALYKESHEEITYNDLKAFFNGYEPALIEHGDGKVVMSYNKDATIYYQDKEGHFEPLTLDEVKTIIYSFSDAAKHFNEGKMYYALPIHHNDVTVPLMKDGKYDTGDFGVVRNHWYRLYVKSIGTVGTPVDDPEDPIIPNDPEEDLNIAMEIVILPWRVIEEPDIRL